MAGHDDVERLVALITVDCYNPSEQVTAFYEVFIEEVPLPTPATVVGTTIDVVGIDIAEDGEELTARCRRGDVVQNLHLSDLVPSRYRSRLDPRGLPPLPWPRAAPGRRTRDMEAVLVVTSPSIGVATMLSNLPLMDGSRSGRWVCLSRSTRSAFTPRNRPEELREPPCRSGSRLFVNDTDGWCRPRSERVSPGCFEKRRHVKAAFSQ